MPASFAVLFLAALLGAAWLDALPAAVAALYVAASALTFIAYARDKSAARTNLWRTRESTLHWFGIAGGWPGALLAQAMLRHKSKKRPFRVLMWTTVVLNCAALAAFLYFRMQYSPAA